MTALMFFAFEPANAALVTNGNSLIYDTDLNITWYDSPNYDTHVYGDYVIWAQGLAVGGVTGWRLPTTPGSNTGFVNEGELGHLFYNELGNSQGGLINKGPFKNLNAEYLGFYTSTSHDGGNYYYFDLGSGKQDLAYIGYYYFWIHGLAVHDGNIGNPVPAPSALLLLGSALTGLVGLNRKKRAEAI